MKTSSLTLCLSLLLGNTITSWAMESVEITEREVTDPLLVIRTDQSTLPTGDPAFREEKKVKITEETGIPTFKKLWGKRDIFLIHPFSEEQHGSVDFSAITEKHQGTLELQFKNHPQGDHRIRILVDGAEIASELIANSDWNKHRIPFDQQRVVVEVIANNWYCEHAFITYKISP